jgi:hypothetical protein
MVEPVQALIGRVLRWIMLAFRTSCCAAWPMA